MDEPYAVVIPYSTWEFDGLSVVQVMTALVEVILPEATFEMTTLAAGATTFMLNCLVADFLGDEES